MDTTTIGIIIVVAIFAIIAIAAFWRYRQQGGAEIGCPFGMNFKVHGSNESTPQKAGISAKGIISRDGGVLAEETTGSGIDVENIDAKDDVLLTSSRNNPQSSPVSIPLGTLSANSLNAGGSITIQQFIGSEATLAQQLAFFINQLGLENIQSSKYAQSQYEAYCNIWRSLQSLRVLGNDLWETASKENVAKFAKQLRKTEFTVREDEIFFEDDDRRHLLRILSAFGDFELGKVRLIDIRSEKDVERYGYGLIGIQRQIEQNREYKLRYEELLDDIRISFKRRLSNLPVSAKDTREDRF